MYIIKTKWPITQNIQFKKIENLKKVLIIYLITNFMQSVSYTANHFYNFFKIFYLLNLF